MNRDSIYYKQVALLMRLIPLIEHEKDFALKGGTAINLFVQNLPRLSVDIDLAYLPFEPRSVALGNIRALLSKVAESINDIPELSATLQDNNPDEMRIIVIDNRGIQVKIEVSPVARGTLLPPTELDVVEVVENEFGYASIQVVSLPDLYGGKLCAAMDRQHPRDLYDVKNLLENQSIDRAIFEGFLTYLLSHKRPLAEIMNPRWKDITNMYHSEFKGMTVQFVSLEELNQTPSLMVKELKKHFTKEDYDFLLSFKKGEPDWSLSFSDTLEKLPAVQWKLLNIKKMPDEKRDSAVSLLEKTMSHWLA
ncbi:nucleotidyl transferase AbiEii/AbiGii toxin family protein [Legionella yabuuchiae]|uniref:nucleotidyl transferase AbiEii/AbiGii toxin family protein n=1 Tax=Legionella yabuuchiae TaxID=376727 RepID=UPI00105436FF|nr:nucleotidyl transferase AbiEii/AbiGii toxin family protein [Legionella yabuuchiae]